jgi:putative two-component system response regulator
MEAVLRIDGESAYDVAGAAQAPKPDHSTVLTVDDDVVLRWSLARALRRLGYNVLEAGGGQEALVVAREQQPDAVLLDLNLPDLPGNEVCRRLRADDATRLIPVVFLTGEHDRQARLAGLEAGATDFLTKPFDLSELAARMRNLVELRQAMAELDSAEAIVFSIARLVEARDRATGDHCDRLASLVVRLGRKLDMGAEELVVLRRAGYLHDIGKIAIPDAVLLKPGRLTAEEWEIMRSHSQIGYDLCLPLRSLRPVLPIILHHHERADGSGYPDGLKGDEIPFLVQVFQVVDVFDALASPRCYRAAMPVATAMAVLREEVRRGLWNPQVVEILGELLEGDGAAPDDRLGPAAL